MEEAVAELRAAFERDPTGFASDELTRSILERLNKEVAALYSEDSGADAAEDTAEEEQPIAPTRSGAKVTMPKGPRPYDLWRATHELNEAVREVSIKFKVQDDRRLLCFCLCGHHRGTRISHSHAFSVR
jgi:hypothetical protein